MEHEAMSYSVSVTVIGMGIVFLFLIFLSFLMAAIKRIFQMRPKTRTVGPRIEGPGSVGWLAAVVAAYQALDQDRVQVGTAQFWRPNPEDRNDSWRQTRAIPRTWSPGGGT